MPPSWRLYGSIVLLARMMQTILQPGSRPDHAGRQSPLRLHATPPRSSTLLTPGRPSWCENRHGWAPFRVPRTWPVPWQPWCRGQDGCRTQRWSMVQTRTPSRQGRFHDLPSQRRVFPALWSRRQVARCLLNDSNRMPRRCTGALRGAGMRSEINCQPSEPAPAPRLVRAAALPVTAARQCSGRMPDGAPASPCLLLRC